MKRFLYIILIALIIITTSLANSNLSITVDDKLVYSDVKPFIKNGTTYVPIRFIANALNVNSVAWDDTSKSVIIKSNNTSILLFVNKNYVYINDEYKILTNNALLVDGRTFVPIRFVSEILGANVEWNNESYTVAISTKQSTYTASTSENEATINKKNTISQSNKHTTTKIPQNNNAKTNNISEETVKTTLETGIDEENIKMSSTYNKQIYNDSIYWLSRIIEAEASGEPYIGKVAVGEVILNRVDSIDFPNTIWEVIFDDNFGIQFEPVANGTIYNSPSEDSIKAATEALNGSNYIKNCLYFLNPQIAKSSWIIKNRQYYTTISNHDFYI